MRSALKVLLLGLLVGQGAVEARPTKRVRRYVLRDVRVEGNASEAEKKLLEERVWLTIELMVSQKSAELVHPEEVTAALKDNPQLKVCFDARCGAELGILLNADKILSIGIERSGAPDKGDWMVRVWHFDARALKIGALDLPCAGRDADGLLGELSHALEPALTLESGPMCMLKVSSRPEGATVFVAGSPVGSTPFQHTVLPGKHTIAVEKSGFSRGEEELECTAGSQENLSFGLTAGGGPAVVHKEQPKKPSPALKIAGAVLIVAGAAALVAGAAELYLDGRGTCDLAPGQTQCKEVYDTKVAGGVLAGVGAAAFVAGVAVLVVDAVRKPGRVTADVGLGPSGAYAGLRGSF